MTTINLTRTRDLLIKDLAIGNWKPPYQEEKRIQSRERFWIVTNAESFKANYYASSSQTLYRFGAIDLNTFHLGYFVAGNDDMSALFSAGVSELPWNKPMPVGYEITRAHHGNQSEGRFVMTATPIQLDPEIKAMGQLARERFQAWGFNPQTMPIELGKISKTAKLKRCIQEVALSWEGIFSRTDIALQVFGCDYSGSQYQTIVRVIAELVQHEKLVPSRNGKQLLYQVAPPPAPPKERSDWAK